VMGSYEGVLANFPGTSGPDNYPGTPEADLIDGLAGDDLLSGLDGNDTINGGNGKDTINGGDGDDVINPGLPGSGFGRISELVDGGNGIDTLVIDRAFSDSIGGPISVSIGSSGGGFISAQIGFNSVGTVNFSSIEKFNIQGDGRLVGGDLNDTLEGNGILIGGGGDDILIGVDRRFPTSNNSTTLSGGAGSDRFIIGESGQLFGGVDINDFGAGDRIEIPSNFTYSLTTAGQRFGLDLFGLFADTRSVALIGTSVALDINNVNQFRRVDGLINFDNNFVAIDPRPTVYVRDFQVSETNNGSFVVSLSKPSAQTVTVEVSTQDGLATITDNDYQGITNQVVTFAPGETEQVVNT
jgi:Ca2+-binding RTX toxin-like protein